MSEYPEHDKVRAVRGQSQAIGSFIEWLRHDKGYEICSRNESGTQDFTPVYTSIEKILAEHFEIDLDKLEDEKEAMLAELRKDGR